MKKCAIVTGASRGIGAGIAEKLASEKWNIALCARMSVEDGSLLAAELQKKYGVEAQLITYVGTVIGAHSGPGTLALFFLGDNR